MKDREYWHLCIGFEPVDEEGTPIGIDDVSLADLLGIRGGDEDYAGRVLIDIIRSATRNLPRKERETPSVLKEQDYAPTDDDEYMSQLRANALYRK